MSKLKVEVCRVEEVVKHPNADKLSTVRIKGWWCITALDQYKVGDLVVYIPPDAVLPDELIAAHGLTYLKKGNRITTLKLRGFISQGLILPNTDNLAEGTNVGDRLNIKKYEPPAPAYQNTHTKETLMSVFQDWQNSKIGFRHFVVKSGWMIKDRYLTPKRKLNPHFQVYTDIENIKHYPEIFSTGEPVVIMLKIHGTNFRCGNLPQSGWQLWRPQEFCYGSHRVQKHWLNRDSGFYEGDVYGYIAKQYDLARVIPADHIVYGEIYGRMDWNQTPIQSGYDYGLNHLRLAVFDVKHGNRYLNYDELVDFCQERNLPMAPLLYRGLFDTQVLKHCTEGADFIDPKVPREGCVVRPLTEQLHPMIGRKILKSINPEYLLTKTTEYH